MQCFTRNLQNSSNEIHKMPLNEIDLVPDASEQYFQDIKDDRERWASLAIADQCFLFVILLSLEHNRMKNMPQTLMPIHLLGM